MASGAKVSKECAEAYDGLKMKKVHRYIIYKMNDKLSEIVVDRTSDRDETYEDMRAELIAASEKRECRYAVFDLDFELNGQPKAKVIFIAWSPENAQIRNKMVYTSSKDYLKKALQLTLECQATDLDELSLENLIEKARRGMKD